MVGQSTMGLPRPDHHHVALIGARSRGRTDGRWRASYTEDIMVMALLVSCDRIGSINHDQERRLNGESSGLFSAPASHSIRSIMVVMDSWTMVYMGVCACGDVRACALIGLMQAPTSTVMQGTSALQVDASQNHDMLAVTKQTTFSSLIVPVLAADKPVLGTWTTFLPDDSRDLQELKVLAGSPCQDSSRAAKAKTDVKWFAGRPVSCCCIHQLHMKPLTVVIRLVLTDSSHAPIGNLLDDIVFSWL
nr:hypothetical protein CFP56_67830 [Quercus suber]